ncbi:heterocyst frequency control protein PatD [Calothrix sp. PCC 6303]|uniref:heterocyst frequency control protein PatD n=1 Tax=Calothrix sp. PCC 6303 TaxID=1170562 RepID=UPI0002A0322C|nr:heterocyst frequency control protein PatD [Calothrix sp. PCC 6303]AFY99844.1 hypothetical protein Cal6303_0778 [Calothrix sp. PCC 6303]
MSLNQDKYDTLMTFLRQLSLNVSVNELSLQELKENIRILQQFFQEQIVPLDSDEWYERSYRTEISKQLRLLDVDILFLQGAKQPATVESRLKAISDRISILISYCQAVLDGKSENES